ncbi:MAG: DUF2834 domain-containing protein [Cyanobacteria bacterium P01_A01_bin.3]
MRQIVFASLWIGFSLYAFLGAPQSDQDSTLALLTDLVNGHFSALNPLLVAEFNLMGVLPLVYCCFLFADGRERKLPAWIFAAGMMGVGGFALLPYLVFRGQRTHADGEPTAFLRFWDSRWVAAILLAIGAGLMAYGGWQGDWDGFLKLWQSQQFVHVMTLDYLLLCALLPVMVYDDLPRRDRSVGGWFWASTCLPFFGPLLYLCLRPSLGASATPSS